MKYPFYSKVNGLTSSYLVLHSRITRQPTLCIDIFIQFKRACSARWLPMIYAHIITPEQNSLLYGSLVGFLKNKFCTGDGIRRQRRSQGGFPPVQTPHSLPLINPSNKSHFDMLSLFIIYFSHLFFFFLKWFRVVLFSHTVGVFRICSWKQLCD